MLNYHLACKSSPGIYLPRLFVFTAAGVEVYKGCQSVTLAALKNFFEVSFFPLPSRGTTQGYGNAKHNHLKDARSVEVLALLAVW